MATLSRRNLLRGQWRQQTAIRPPWAMDESVFINSCSRCGDCVSACETGVIIVGHGGLPELDFQRAECSFCALCLQACQQPIFNRQVFIVDESDHRDSPNEQLKPVAPWEHIASIGDSCLAFQGVECRSCQDSCQPGAISFKARLGGIAPPDLDPELCNGCGACISSCPIKAITIEEKQHDL